MSVPRDHHYIPASYLKRWCGGADAKLQEFRLTYRRKIVTKRISGEATGFQKDLYKARTVEIDKSQIFETDFLRPIDERAYNISSRMINGDMTLNKEDRIDWARFLLSSTLRSPQDLADLEAWVGDEWSKDSSLSTRTSDDLRNICLRLFIRICNDKSIPAICGMQWQILSVIADLATSDRPLIMTNGIGHNDSYIILPLAPRLAFFAFRSRGTYRDITGIQLTALPHKINDVVISRAKEFVWSTDLSMHKFVKKNMATVPSPSIISMLRAGRRANTIWLDHP